ARLVARPITVFIAITSFFTRFLSSLSKLLVRLLGVKQSADESAVNEEEINQMIIEGSEQGLFDETEKAFVRSVFDFADSTVSRAMTPRTDVIGIEKSAPSEEILKIILDNGYSRYPVFDRTIDDV